MHVAHSCLYEVLNFNKGLVTPHVYTVANWSLSKNCWKNQWWLIMLEYTRLQSDLSCLPCVWPEFFSTSYTMEKQILERCEILSKSTGVQLKENEKHLWVGMHACRLASLVLPWTCLSTWKAVDLSFNSHVANSHEFFEK